MCAEFIHHINVHYLRILDRASFFLNFSPHLLEWLPGVIFSSSQRQSHSLAWSKSGTACPILAGACFRSGHVTQWGGDGKGNLLEDSLRNCSLLLKWDTHTKSNSPSSTGHCHDWVWGLGGCRHRDTTERTNEAQIWPWLEPRKSERSRPRVWRACILNCPTTDFVLWEMANALTAYTILNQSF